jgi:hypothetical protein
MRIRNVMIILGVLAALGVGASQAFGEGGETPPPLNAPDPMAAYQAPTGPIVPDATLTTKAMSAATMAGDASPESITAVNTTFADAIRAMEPETEVSPPTSSGMASFESSTMVLVVAQGHFDLTTAHVPKGHKSPEGTVLALGYNAQTGMLEYRALFAEVPQGLAGLGVSRILSGAPSAPAAHAARRIGPPSPAPSIVVRGTVLEVVTGPHGTTSHQVHAGIVVSARRTAPGTATRATTDAHGHFRLLLQPDARYTLNVIVGPPTVSPARRCASEAIQTHQRSQQITLHCLLR